MVCLLKYTEWSWLSLVIATKKSITPWIFLQNSNLPISLNKEKEPNLFRSASGSCLDFVVNYYHFFHTGIFLLYYSNCASELMCLHFTSTREFPTRYFPWKNIFQVEGYKLEIWLYIHTTPSMWLYSNYWTSLSLCNGDSNTHLHHLAQIKQVWETIQSRCSINNGLLFSPLHSPLFPLFYLSF